MKLPAIFRIVTNGKQYAVQRKAGINSEWKLCTYFAATSDFSGVWVPFTYPFRWMAHWKMCRLIADEHAHCKIQNEVWEHV